MSTRMRPEFASTAGEWDFISCHCYVRLAASISVCITNECAACGNTNIHFSHTLQHTDGRQIDVGIECASVLLEDYELPRLAENEVKRKEGWRIHYKKPGRCVAGIEDLAKRGKL